MGGAEGVQAGRGRSGRGAGVQVSPLLLPHRDWLPHRGPPAPCILFPCCACRVAVTPGKPSARGRAGDFFRGEFFKQK